MNAYDKNGVRLEPGMKVRYEVNDYVIEGTFKRFQIGSPMICSKIVIDVDGEERKIWNTNNKYLTVITETKEEDVDSKE